jgi:hypothetical protein
MAGRDCAIDERRHAPCRLSSTSLRSNLRCCCGAPDAAALSIGSWRGLLENPLRLSSRMRSSRSHPASPSHKSNSFTSSSSPLASASASPAPLMGPRPPMPRVHPSVLMNSMEQMNAEASQQSHTRTLVSRLRNWYDRPGSVLLLVGWSALALVVLDRYLQYVDRQDAVRLVASVSVQQQRERDEMHRKFASAPALYRVEVVTAYHEMGGTHGLQARLAVGGVLEVLQEHVGPSGLYVMVRTSRPVSAAASHGEGKDDNEGAEPPQIGWYPRAFVKAVVEEEPSASASGRGIFRRIWGGRK